MKKTSLKDLDLTASSEESYEFEYMPKGKPTGIFISVIGGQSKKVLDWTMAETNKIRKKEIQAQRRGKNQDAEPIENDLEYMIQSAAVRIVGWRGIDEPYNHENALELCRLNAVIRSQAIQESNEIANFTKI